MRFFRFLAFGFRFSAKIQAVFRIWYPMGFLVFRIWFLVMRLNRVGGRASRITPGTSSCTEEHYKVRLQNMAANVPATEEGQEAIRAESNITGALNGPQGHVRKNS